MGSKFLCIFMLIASIVGGAYTSQTHDLYWRFGADQSGPSSESYHVGDKLVFRYPASLENVIEVDSKSFENCIVPPSAKVLNSGFDVINLDTPGPRWFICGVGNGQHCKDGGMKIHVNVTSPNIVQTSSDEEIVHVTGDDDKPKPRASHGGRKLASSN